MAIQGLVKFDKDKDVRNYIEITEFAVRKVPLAQPDEQGRTKLFNAQFVYRESLMNGEKRIPHSGGVVEVLLDVNSTIPIFEQGYIAIKAKEECSGYTDVREDLEG